MERFPVFLCLKQRLCLVVGGGRVALRKTKSLLQAGAQLSIVAPEINPELQAVLQQYPDSIHYQPRAFIPNDLTGVFLVIAATDQRAVNAQIASLANKQNIPVNVVDSQQECSFTLASVVDRSPVKIAVSTGGASPVLARQLRMRLETMIPASYGQLAAITEAYRDPVKQRFSNPDLRKRFWEQALRGPLAELVYTGNIDAARQMLEDMIARGSGIARIGEVYLVGAGPGDPDLLTFRALRLMQQADVVVHDRLVAKSILDMANQNAERIYVGKEKANHAVPQNKINNLLVDLAKQGKQVLRLKGGDPFIFGRGGEEIEALAKQGIPFQIVPGITAASGCASYAGIPLTHRDYAQSCTFATGHLKDGSIDLDWEKLARPGQTIVFYMGLSGIAVISQQLMAQGMSADMPAALVEQGTTRNQRVHIGTLASLPNLVKERKVRAPALTIVGEVVQLHEKLRWYEPKHPIAASEFSRKPAQEH
ncbi:MAG: uroporphyrinogen-III C-methyltransferase [Proteobacteria bacterium]|nr:MAG: uroporphyrinogen-III C-methyltransferase [Pseudomonadota bacterium]